MYLVYIFHISVYLCPHISYTYLYTYLYTLTYPYMCSTYPLTCTYLYTLTYVSLYLDMYLSL